MSETKHTPGPWNYVKYRSGGILLSTPSGALNIRTDKSNIDEQEANARLICAAPDLLAACEHFLGFSKFTCKKCDKPKTMCEICLITRTRKAVAKAKVEATP